MSASVVTELGAVLTREYGVNFADEDFSVTVVVTNQTAYCTCMDYWKGYGKRAVHPQRYFGSTIAHGCRHVDLILDTYGFTVQCDHRNEDPNRIFEASEDALVHALELGFKAGARGYVLMRPKKGED